MVAKAQFDDDVKILKEWHLKQPHLPEEIDEDIYYTIVSGTKGIEIAKSKLDGYLSLRNRIFKLLETKDPFDGLRERFKKAGLFFLPGQTPEGYKVLFFAISKLGDTTNDDVMKYSMMIMEAMLSMEPTATSLVTVVDYKHIKPSLAKLISFPKVKAFNSYYTKTLAIRSKKTIIMSIPYFFDKIIDFALSITPKKVSERLVKWKDHTSLPEVLPIEMIPSDYGGKGLSVEELVDYWAGVIESKKDMFQRLSELKADESKRPKDSYKWEAMDFGIEGSFKSLNID